MYTLNAITPNFTKKKLMVLKYQIGPDAIIVAEFTTNFNVETGHTN